MRFSLAFSCAFVSLSPQLWLQAPRSRRLLMDESVRTDGTVAAFPNGFAEQLLEDEVCKAMSELPLLSWLETAAQRRERALVSLLERYDDAAWQACNDAFKAKWEEERLQAFVAAQAVRGDEQVRKEAAEWALFMQEEKALQRAAWLEHRDWAEALEKDESLRQPTRTWGDGLLDGPSGTGYGGLLSAAEEQALLLAAAGDSEDAALALRKLNEAEELPEIVSKYGVKAPAWFVRAKLKAEKKQELERLEWGGVAPSGAAGPFPIGPEGRELEPLRRQLSPLQQAIEGSLRQSIEGSADMVGKVFGGISGGETASLPSSGAPLTSPPLSDAPEDAPWNPFAKAMAMEREERAARAAARRAADESAALRAEASARAKESAPRSATESALARAQLLALGLSRLREGAASSRQTRLLCELEAAVKELQAEGFKDAAALADLKGQLSTSLAAAPSDVLREFRKARGGRTLTLQEIATDIQDMIRTGNIELGPLAGEVGAFGGSIVYDVTKLKLAIGTPRPKRKSRFDVWKEKRAAEFK